jgi:hypothetical protein
MNTLEHYLQSSGFDETDAMNLLQMNGIISDNCITASEVSDSGKAVAWLNNLPTEQQPKKTK